MNAILTRWRANGGSAFDPYPTLGHHLVHILTGCFVALVLSAKVGLDPVLVGLIVLLIPSFLEFMQIKGWLFEKANVSDSIFDAYQYQAGLIWLLPVGWGLWSTIVFIVVYLILLLTLVNKEGNPV